ncbi:MAG: MAPEG family protein [Gammaproteobacteria bacterium]
MALITGFYAALIGFFIIYLGKRVAYCRRDHQIGIGGENHRELNVLVRAHANAIENAPITLLLMLLAELNGLNGGLLHLYGIALVASRIAHAKGFIDSQGRYHVLRFYGILVNWIVIAALGMHNLWFAFFG